MPGAAAANECRRVCTVVLVACCERRRRRRGGVGWSDWRARPRGAHAHPLCTRQHTLTPCQALVRCMRRHTQRLHATSHIRVAAAAAAASGVCCACMQHAAGRASCSASCGVHAWCAWRVLLRGVHQLAGRAAVAAGAAAHAQHAAPQHAPHTAGTPAPCAPCNRTRLPAAPPPCRLPGSPSACRVHHVIPPHYVITAPPHYVIVASPPRSTSTTSPS